MRKVVIIPLDKINVDKAFTVGSDQPVFSKDRSLSYWETVTLVVEGKNTAGYGIGFVPSGFQARQVMGGSLVPGPWAYAYPHAAVIDDQGGTKAELVKARLDNRLCEASLGDLLEIGGSYFEIQNSRDREIELFKVEPTRIDLIMKSVAVLLNGDLSNRLVYIACSQALYENPDGDPAVVIGNMLKGITKATTKLRKELQAIDA